MLPPESSQAGRLPKVPAPMPMAAVREQATRALWAGAASSAATALLSALAPDALVPLALDAFRMALLMTAVVPPATWLGGWVLSRMVRNSPK